MVQIADIRDIAAKWKRVTAARQLDYKQGVLNPRRDWATATEEAKELWALGIQEAIANDRFGRGVLRAGTRKWQTNTLEKGPARWSQGVNLALDAYAQGFGPYRDAIESIVLPPRGTRGSPENILRVTAITETLHALKVEMG